jgi:hypothetical protein
MRVDAVTPASEMVRHDEVIALRQVAPISEHEVLDCIVGPASPRKEVVYVSSSDEPLPAVEASATLHVVELVDESLGKGRSLGPEEVRLKCCCLQPDSGPSRDVACPVEFDERTDHRSKHDQPLRDAVE